MTGLALIAIGVALIVSGHVVAGCVVAGFPIVVTVVTAVLEG